MVNRHKPGESTKDLDIEQLWMNVHKGKKDTHFTVSALLLSKE
jgi:hypothetical protein